MIRNLIAFVLILTGLGFGLHAYLQTQQARLGADPVEGVDGPAQASVPRERRSVLLITTDTTRADHLEPYGYEGVTTPTLNRLAEEGVVFTQANAVAPITLPAHSSIHTGLYPNQHGVRNNGIHYLPDTVETMAERLGGKGFRTAAFVSAAVLERQFGLNQGFEVYDDDLSAGRERRPRVVADRPAEATVDAATGWLDGLDPSEDFFLWVHFYDPHAMYSPPAPFRDLYRENLYDGEIAYMDSQIATLLDHPLVNDDNTIIVVMGDHGESLGEHGERTHALLAYQSTLRVPFFLKAPGIHGGIRVHEPVSQVDFVPTVLALLNMDPPEGLPGRSLIPLITRQPSEEASPQYSETYLPFYTYGWAKLRTLRSGRFKYIDAPAPELYDLQRDPSELSNLFDSEPGVVHDLSMAMQEQFEDVAPDAEPRLDLDTDALDRLRGLGYLAVGSGTTLVDDADRPDPKDVIHLHVGLERARRFLSDQLWDRALRQLEAVLIEDPANLAALQDLATAQEGADLVDEAVETLKQALELDPGYPRTYVALGNLEFRRGNHELALELLDTALGIDPRFLSAELSKTNVLMAMDRMDEMLAVAETMIEQHPTEPIANVQYARLVERRAGNVEAAEERIAGAAARDPFLATAWVSLGQLQEAQNRDAEAEQSYRTGLSKQPDDAALHGNLGVLLARTGADAEAERHLREAIRLSNGFRSEYHLALGAWLAEHGQIEAAEAEYAKVLTRQPDNQFVRNNRAIAYFRAGRLEDAIAEFEQIIETHPNYADAHNNLSAAAIAMHDWPKAETHARRALELNPNAIEAYNNLGIALDEQGQPEAAETAFRDALTVNPDYRDARLNLAITLKGLERWTEAETEFNAVLDSGGLYPMVHRELGELYAGPLKDLRRARAHYNAYLKTSPRAQDAEEIRSRLAALDGAVVETVSPSTDGP